jgi:sec-independent protein translocase protein TatB
MIDFGFDKIALIGAVALIVIGPEKLPRVARTVGALMGKARRYVADVKAEVSRSIELEELQKMKSQFETAARDVEQTVSREVSEAQHVFHDQLADLGQAAGDAPSLDGAYTPPLPEYKRPNKRWRLKRSALPRWYKQRQGLRGHVQSGAARVARHRPPGLR